MSYTTATCEITSVIAVVVDDFAVGKFCFKCKAYFMEFSVVGQKRKRAHIFHTKIEVRTNTIRLNYTTILSTLEALHWNKHQTHGNQSVLQSESFVG